MFWRMGVNMLKFTDDNKTLSIYAPLDYISPPGANIESSPGNGNSLHNQ